MKGSSSASFKKRNMLGDLTQLARVSQLTSEGGRGKKRVTGSGSTQAEMLDLLFENTEPQLSLVNK